MVEILKMDYYSNNTRQHYSELAKQHSLPFVILSSTIMNSDLLNLNSRFEYIQLQAIPISQTDTTIIIATANPSPENQKKIHAFFNASTKKSINLVVASMQEITYTLANQFKETYTHTMTHCRDDLDLFHSASHTFSLTEKIVLILLVAFLLIAALGNFFITALWVNVFLATGTLLVMSYKNGLMMCTLRLLKKRPIEIIKPQTEYPIYTILLPLLHEKQATITLLIDSLNRLDYPAEKLDIKFLLEQDDTQTLNVINKLDLPWYYQVLIVPSGLPRSKPRACNYGLQFALGPYLTIFDAEDRPDPDQLRKAFHRFLHSAENVACVQAALNFYNYRENLLTKLFTMEYTFWFDYLIPALDSLRAPVPLGGTSNHFKTEVLYKIGGWDPFIGTEDAEIGVRLYRYGYRVESIPSTTYEEANTRLGNWFLQRTRWNKGYMQTYLVNMRDPINMIKQIGPGRFINFQFFVGGNVFIQLANLPLWIFLLSTVFFYNAQVASLFPKLLLYITIFNFFISNLLLLILEFIATYNRRLYCLLPFIPFKMFYWILMSLSGYYAIVDLLLRPGYWYKTEHGISKQGNNTDVPL